MPDCVVDATIIYKANGDIAAGRRPGNILDRRLIVIEQIGSGARRLRYNSKLLNEYQQVAREHRNDVVELFFTALAERAVLVTRNKLSPHLYARATQCRWPSHDQHLLAAAVDGTNPTIFVTERRHVNCADCVLRRFAVHVEDLG